MTYRLVYAAQAVKDAKKLKSTPLVKKVKKLLAIIEEDPFTSPPPFEKMTLPFRQK